MPKPKKTASPPVIKSKRGKTTTALAKNKKSIKPKLTTDDGEINFGKLLNTVAKKVGYTFDILDKRIEDSIHTGSFALDVIIGGGYPPAGRVNIFGKEQGGKSTLVYHACGSAVNEGIHTVFFDYEGSTDGARLLRISPNLIVQTKKKDNKFHYAYTMESGEQCFHSAFYLMKNHERKLKGKSQMVIAVDSLAAMLPNALVTKPEDARLNLHAFMLSLGFRMVKGSLAAKRCLWIDTNQIRYKPTQYGNPEYETGGEASKFYSDIRIKATQVKREGFDKEVEEPSIDGGVDHYTFSKIETIKNKMYAPFKKCYIRMWISHGSQQMGIIDPFWDVIEYLDITGQLRMQKKVGVGKVITTSFPGIDYLFNKYKKLKKEGEALVIKYSTFKKLVFKELPFFQKTFTAQIVSGEAHQLYSLVDAPTICSKDEDIIYKELGELLTNKPVALSSENIEIVDELNAIDTSPDQDSSPAKE